MFSILSANHQHPRQQQGIEVEDKDFAMLGPAAKSTKRKLDDIESDEGAYVDPRQSIFSISMCKLKTSPVRRVEPSLRRSVLIFNTLKIIERELQKEGLPITSSETPLSLPAMETDDFTLDNVRDVHVGHIGPAGLHVHVPVPEQRNAHACTTFTPRDDVKIQDKDSTCLTEEPTYTSLGSSHLYPSMDSEDSVGLSEVTDSLARQTVTDWISSAHSLMPFTSMSSISFKNEDLRTEMDMPFSDFDFMSAFPQSTKLPPLSAEEIVHSFGSQNPGLPDPYPAISNTQCCKSDIICEDFDNIMQILVGM